MEKFESQFIKARIPESELKELSKDMLESGHYTPAQAIEDLAKIGVAPNPENIPRTENINTTIPESDRDEWERVLTDNGFSKEEAEAHLKIMNMSRLQKDIRMGKIKVVPVKHTRRSSQIPINKK